MTTASNLRSHKNCRHVKLCSCWPQLLCKILSLSRILWILLIQSQVLFYITISQFNHNAEMWWRGSGDLGLGKFNWGMDYWNLVILVLMELWYKFGTNGTLISTWAHPRIRKGPTHQVGNASVLFLINLAMTGSFVCFVLLLLHLLSSTADWIMCPFSCFLEF